ncbi:hypothetical protein RRG08_066688 [Elysia crispata]|uniref:Uncharacterized protein n=1 Tax=Elysia crispata TaxID=231223 RepID=A0AAE0ZRV6_9GAST|nr:hypothetical protein RRG08_066688 [Elysia crispata]
MASASPVTGREDHTASPISTINMDELSHLKSITEDDVYQQLRRHFIRYGKGRPCDLPKVDGVTNGLLLKLYVIKEECNASFRELKDWLTKLVPNTESVSESRVYHTSAFYRSSKCVLMETVGLHHFFKKATAFIVYQTLSLLMDSNDVTFLEQHPIPSHLPVILLTKLLLIWKRLGLKNERDSLLFTNG